MSSPRSRAPRSIYEDVYCNAGGIENCSSNLRQAQLAFGGPHVVAPARPQSGQLVLRAARSG